VDLFVGDPWIPMPNYTNFNWSSASDVAEIVEVPPGAVACGGNASCPFYLSVTGYSMGLATYTIVVANVSGPITLADGVPVDGVVVSGDYDHYNITVVPSSTFHSLTFSLVSGYGDPDIYITANDASGAWPSTTYYTWAGKGSAGSDMVTVSFADPKFSAACPPNTPCRIAASVYGYTTASYTLTATSSGGYTQLIAGIPATGFVSAGSYAYFNFTPSTPDNFTIAVTALSGDPDVYVSATNPAPNQGAGNYTWAAASDADEIIRIGTADPNFRAPPAWYAIGVYGWGGNTSFSVLARMDAANFTAKLSDGVPQAASAAPHSFAYFSYTLAPKPPGATHVGVDIAVSPQLGDTDLYVSNLTTTGPGGTTVPVFPQVVCTYRLSTGKCGLYGVDKSTYTWSSANQGTQDFVSISRAAINPGQAIVIGVLATTPDLPSGAAPDPSVFSVVAASGDTAMVLPTGVQVPGAVTASAYKYYSYTVSAWNMDIVIAATVRSGGAVDIYVAEGFTPGFGNSTWNTSVPTGIIRDKYVLIPFSSLSPACQQSTFSGSTCTLSVAVQGWKNMGPGAESIYTISAQISGNPSYPYWLQAGWPVYTFIPAFGAEYFYSSIDIPPSRTIYVTVQNMLGSTTMYLNLGTGRGFWTPGGPPADLTSPDVGGFERAVIPPPSAGVGGAGTATAAAAAAGRLSAVLHVAADAENGAVSVVAEDVEGVLADNDAARVVATHPSGAAVIALRLRAAPPAGAGADADAGVEPAPFAAPAVAPPLAVTGGRVPSTLPAYSSVAVRARAAGRWASPALLAAYAGAREAADEARAARVAVPPPAAALGVPAYCSSCEMFVTVTSGRQDANVVVSFFGGETYVNLLDGVPLEGFSPPDGYAYYAFQVGDPTQDVTISVTQTFGQAQVFVLVQEPTASQVMPYAYLYQWAFDPWAGVSTLVVNHTDPSFCVPLDNSPPGTPCTLLIGVLARNNDTAAYTIAASASSSGLTRLYDGVPAYGSVAEGQPVYYTFQACAPGLTVPPAILSWTNLFGSVTAYVTNGYVPGSSLPAYLPGPGSKSCQWVATNYSGTGLFPGDPCYDPNLPLYTIAVYGATGTPGATSQYAITAVVAGDPTVLTYGTPTTNIFLPGNLNQNFSFTLGFSSSQKDLLVVATPTYGEIALLVAHDDPVNNTVPSCSQPCRGCRTTCTGYTWLMPSFGASPALYIPAGDPCHPIVPPGAPAVVVSPTCNATTSFRPGRYWAVLFGFPAMSEASLVVTQPGLPVVLPDGQPQDLQTGPVTLCPTRDNITGLCTGDPSTWTPNVQGGFFTLRVPASDAGRDAYVLLDRLCGNTTGFCGAPLHAYVSACRDTGPGACDPNAPYPSAAGSRSDVVVSDVQASIKVSYSICGGFGVGDCLVYVAVYPICGTGGGQPGVGCPPTLFRATLSTDTGIERVPTDCFANGATCVLPEVSGTVGAVKRYEADAGGPGTPVTIVATACSGTLNSYYCDGIYGTCNPVSQPGPSNYDATAGTDLHGAASIAVTVASGLFFLGVRASSQAGAGSPTYQLTLQAGAGPLLVVSPINPYVGVNRASPTSFAVLWDSAYLAIPGQMPYRATGATYAVYAFPLGSTGQARTDTPCGVDDAVATTANVVSAATPGNEITLAGLNPGVSYVVSVVGTCGAATCMPGNGMAQRVAAYPTTVPPAPPSPGPSPSAAPPAPAPKPSASGLSPAGAAAVSVVVLVGAAVGGFFAYRRFGGGAGGAAGRYAPASGGWPEWLSPSRWFGGRRGYDGYSLAADAGGLFTSSALDADGISLQNEGQDATYTAL
jgi:hypothetical protein